MYIQEMLLTPNQFSRPCTKRKQTTKIAVHYVGNPNTTALNNRNYFENLKNQKANATGIRYVSSHYVIGLEGEIIRCVPDNEIAYTTNQANAYSIGIETCHPKSDGIFSNATYVSLCELCASLLKKYNLTINDLIRHYDVTGKQCPLHWSPTKYQSEALATARWNTFKNDVQTVLNGGKVVKNNTVFTTIPTTTTPTTTTTTSYIVKITSSDGTLNVRTGAGVSYPIATQLINNKRSNIVLKNGQLYTIVEEKKVGTAIWGKLKSGAGWINLGYTKKM